MRERTYKRELEEFDELVERIRSEEEKKISNVEDGAQVDEYFESLLEAEKAQFERVESREAEAVPDLTNPDTEQR